MEKLEPHLEDGVAASMKMIENGSIPSQHVRMSQN